jgi:site-specific DNA-methyltransferase (adenine-specific)
MSWRDQVIVVGGDSIDVLATLPDGCIDSVVCDPPYGLSDIKPEALADVIQRWAAGDREVVPDGKGFMGKDWDKFVPPPALWDECYRLLKPGGHLLAFAGTRTFDIMAMSIRFAGFEIRDSIAWLSGSGFPKSLDVSKAIDKAAGAEREVIGTRKGAGIGGASTTFAQDAWTEAMRGPQDLSLTAPATDAAKQWQGWGTALKPSHEPIVVGRKPIQGTVAANVTTHGTGALNIDATRVGGESGRWPANVVLDGDMADLLDQQSGIMRDGVAVKRNKDASKIESNAVFGEYRQKPAADQTYGGSGGASRFFPTFRYQAKAPKKERPKVDGVAHPTVKPLTLMSWLVKLVTPPGGTVLDPFAGSGTTGEAAYLEGFNAILIEREDDYLPLIEARMSKHDDDEEASA